MLPIRGSRLISKGIHSNQTILTTTPSSDKFKVLIVGGGKQASANHLPKLVVYIIYVRFYL